ncbi:MAG: HAD domain-containing protein [Motiliproteus sp.]|nr:HAD domain-containing protein [Motiliproteus sp.]MCW9053526.1 HAD domain-containing protein [Motiliproteus sp.]
MSNRVLFLDLDGVILPGRALHTAHNAPLVEAFRQGTPLAEVGEQLQFAPDCLEHLRRIVERSNCKLVVISTWRKTFFGGDKRRCIIDVLVDKGLSRDWFHEHPVAPYKMTSAKVHEILFWLDGQSEDVDWLLLDDDVGVLNGLSEPARHVQTDFEQGLSDREVEQIVTYWRC